MPAKSLSRPEPRKGGHEFLVGHGGALLGGEALPAGGRGPAHPTADVDADLVQHLTNNGVTLLLVPRLVQNIVQSVVNWGMKASVDKSHEGFVCN